MAGSAFSRGAVLLLLVSMASHVSSFTMADLQDLTAGALSSQTSLDFCSGDNATLSGPIPRELGRLRSLTSLRICNQQLSGPIPPHLGNLSNLVVLNLGSNQLSGPIPKELGKLTTLYELDLSRNDLFGPIPPDLGNLTSLGILNLSYTNTVGPIPKQLGNLSNLVDLELRNNELTGPIPEEFSQLANLTILALQSNGLDGGIPPALGNLSSLNVLALQDNLFSGPIPPQLASLANLTDLNLWNNSLSGQIPSELGSLSNLLHMYVQNNSLSGPIPASLANLTHLEHLVLEYNSLTGPIPSELGALARTTLLSLAGNQLTGPIPASLQNMTNLQELYLLRNNLTGPIPPGFSNLTQIRTLNLERNQLSGAIPPSLAQAPNLANLVLQYNNLSGPIPPGFFSRFGLANIVTGNPGLNIYGSAVTLTQAPRSGVVYPPIANEPVSVAPIPPPPATESPSINETSSPTSATSPAIAPEAANPIAIAPSGFPQATAPSTIAHSSRNSFPSFAAISATIAANLVLLLAVILAATLCYFKQSKGKHKRSVATTDLELGGCDAPEPPDAQSLYALPRVSPQSRSSSTSAFVVGEREPLASRSPVRTRPRARNGSPHVAPSGHRGFSLRELRAATNDFGESNIIGRGLSATVYRATLGDGSDVAVKRLAQGEGLDEGLGEGLDETSWHAELEALGKVRHKNLVRLLGLCMKGGERLLVLEFFSGGSLVQRLSGAGPVLTWEERMNIVEGVARGLAYMHHDVSPPLLHRNLTAANVLLRGSARALEACIGDFGLACLVRDADPGSLSYAATDDPAKPTCKSPSMSVSATMSKSMSAKRDVYSFGVLVLEVITGRLVTEATEGSEGGAEAALVDSASRAVLVDGRGLALVDPAVADAFDALEAERCISIALECLQQDAVIRPTMESVNLRLKLMRSRRAMRTRARSGIPGFMSP